MLSRPSYQENYRPSRTSSSSCGNITRRSTHVSWATRSSSMSRTRSGMLPETRQHVCRSTQTRSRPACSQCASRHPIYPVPLITELQIVTHVVCLSRRQRVSLRTTPGGLWHLKLFNSGLRRSTHDEDEFENTPRNIAMTVLIRFRIGLSQVCHHCSVW